MFPKLNCILFLVVATQWRQQEKDCSQFLSEEMHCFKQLSLRELSIHQVAIPIHHLFAIEV